MCLAVYARKELWRSLTKVLSIFSIKHPETDLSRSGVEHRPPASQADNLPKSYLDSLLICLYLSGYRTRNRKRRSNKREERDEGENICNLSLREQKRPPLKGSPPPSPIPTPPQLPSHPPPPPLNCLLALCMTHADWNPGYNVSVTPTPTWLLPNGRNDGRQIDKENLTPR